jgi:hypothetical protein
MCLANLGNSLLTRGDEQDVDEVVDAFDEAVDLTPPAAPQRAPYLMNLGAALTARARVRPDSGDLDRGIAAIDAAFAARSRTTRGVRRTKPISQTPSARGSTAASTAPTSTAPSRPPTRPSRSSRRRSPWLSSAGRCSTGARPPVMTTS